jgi:hypothetical protein
VICNSVFVAPRIVFQVGLVEPVELRGIRRGHGGPARGTGGTGARAAHTAEERISLVGSTGPTDRSHQNQQNCLQYHRFHPVTRKRDGSLRKNENVSVA